VALKAVSSCSGEWCSQQYPATPTPSLFLYAFRLVDSVVPATGAERSLRRIMANSRRTGACRAGWYVSSRERK